MVVIVKWRTGIWRWQNKHQADSLAQPQVKRLPGTSQHTHRTSMYLLETHSCVIGPAETGHITTLLSTHVKCLILMLAGG